MRYRVLVLSWKIKDWKESKYSVHALGYNTYLAFKKMKDVEVFYYDKSEENLPQVDFVILITYVSDKIDIQKIKERTGAIKTCSLRECDLKCDFSFLFNPKVKTKNSYLLSPPCNKDILKPTQKMKNTILIDHYWKTSYFDEYKGCDTDWTFLIEDWLEEIHENKEIYRLLRFKDEEKDIKSFEIPLKYASYLRYLVLTARIETFIATHLDSFSYGIIDMAARGTRILSPEGFMPKCFVDAFGIETFKDRDGFMKLINMKPNKEILNKNIENCISFEEIATIMDEHFKRWLNGVE